jgi:anti-anti-sigma regulatory factor
LLECRIENQRAFLSGTIDEHTDLDPTFARLVEAPGDPLILDLRDVTRINSIGLRNWMQQIRTLTAHRHVIMEAISYVFAMQMSLNGIMGSGVVVSSVAPYYCPKCDANRMMLVTREEFRAVSAVPAKACPECQTVMDFDELEDYFRFLADRPQRLIK